jgi:hypothetical protein
MSNELVDLTKFSLWLTHGNVSAKDEAHFAICKIEIYLVVHQGCVCIAKNDLKLLIT